MEIIGQIDGRDVYAVTLHGSSGLRLRIVTFGARLTELWVADRQDNLADIVLGHDRLQEYQASTTYAGATCGRYANRISGGQCAIAGRSVQLDRNEGTKQLHGGRSGFDRKIWQIAALSSDEVTLTAESPDGEMGYPGHLTMTCRYRIDSDNRLWIEMEAETSATTIVNMVNHSYFNMAGQGSGEVLGQNLRLAAGFYTPVDADLIPTGAILPVEGTAFDFMALRPIGQMLPDPLGFDHNLCLSEPALQTWGEPLRFCAEAADPASGRRMALWTSAPGVQFYTGGYLDNSLPGKNGAAYGPFSGFALETQIFPDAPNRPHFPSASLEPGQKYRHLMVFDFTPA